MKNIAVYPGTFDPVTLGHVDIVERAAKLFERVIVAIAENPNKKPLFNLHERVQLAQQVFQKMLNVSVIGFNTLLTDFMYQQQARVILRGLRAVSDFDYEFQLAGMNRHLAPDIESLFLTPAEHFTYISSSFVKEIAGFKGDVSQFVPKVVADALTKKFAGV